MEAWVIHMRYYLTHIVHWGSFGLLHVNCDKLTRSTRMALEKFAGIRPRRYRTTRDYITVQGLSAQGA